VCVCVCVRVCLLQEARALRAHVHVPFMREMSQSADSVAMSGLGFRV
jgi:hypothetical protein